jgi:acyl-coenzyme A thioesterase PaaI-like protein
VRRPLIFRDPQNRCFGCGPSNPAGLRLEFTETETGVEVAYTVPEHLQGAAGIAHGGIQATILDETLCMTAYAKLGTPVFTGELTVRYLRPTPTATPLVARGWIVEPREGSAFIEGAIYLASSGEELTRARGRFFHQQARTDSTEVRSSEGRTGSDGPG